MPTLRTLAQEAAEDLFFGQIVIIWARWFFIAATAAIALIGTDDTTQVTAAILLVILLLATNFFLHTRYVLEQPVNHWLLSSVAIIDLVLITTLILFWPERSGYHSEFYVLYYPLLFAFALVFSPRFTLLYLLIALSLYVGACFIVNFDFITSLYNFYSLITRLITLASMGGLGTFYWRIQRDRQRNNLIPPTTLK